MEKVQNFGHKATRSVNHLIHEFQFQKALAFACGISLCSVLVFIPSITYAQACLAPVAFSIIWAFSPTTLGGIIEGAIGCALGALLGAYLGVLAIFLSFHNKYLATVWLVLLSSLFYQLRSDARLFLLVLVQSIAMASVLLRAFYDVYNIDYLFELVKYAVLDFSIYGPAFSVFAIVVFLPYRRAHKLTRKELACCLRTIARINRLYIPLYVNYSSTPVTLDQRDVYHQQVAGLNRAVIASITTLKKLTRQAAFEPRRRCRLNFGISPLISLVDDCAFAANAIALFWVTERQFVDFVVEMYFTSLRSSLSDMYSAMNRVLDQMADGIQTRRWVDVSADLKVLVERYKANREHAEERFQRVYFGRGNTPAPPTEVCDIAFLKLAEELLVDHVTRLAALYNEHFQSRLKPNIFLIIFNLVKTWFSVPLNVLVSLCHALKATALVPVRLLHPILFLEDSQTRATLKFGLGVFLLSLPLLFSTPYRDFFASTGGVWALNSYITVWKETVESTASQFVLRLIGSVAGSVLGFLIVWMAPHTIGAIVAWRFVWFGLAMYFSKYSQWMYAFVLFCFTLDIVGLCQFQNLSSSPEETTLSRFLFAVARCASVLIGSSLALLIVHVVWPVWASEVVPARFANIANLCAKGVKLLHLSYIHSFEGDIGEKMKNEASQMHGQVNVQLDQCRSMIEAAALWRKGIYKISQRTKKLLTLFDELFTALRATELLVFYKPSPQLTLLTTAPPTHPSTAEATATISGTAISTAVTAISAPATATATVTATASFNPSSVPIAIPQQAVQHEPNLPHTVPPHESPVFCWCVQPLRDEFGHSIAEMCAMLNGAAETLRANRWATRSRVANALRRIRISRTAVQTMRNDATQTQGQASIEPQPVAEVGETQGQASIEPQPVAGVGAAGVVVDGLQMFHRLEAALVGLYQRREYRYATAAGTMPSERIALDDLRRFNSWLFLLRQTGTRAYDIRRTVDRYFPVGGKKMHRRDKRFPVEDGESTDATGS